MIEAWMTILRRYGPYIKHMGKKQESFLLSFQG
jgi:hypothetical protein